MVDSIIKSIEFIDKSNVGINRKNIIFNYLAYQFMVLMAYYHETKENQVKVKIKKLDYLLNYDEYKKVRIINLLRKLVGFNVTALLMNKFVRNRK